MKHPSKKRYSRKRGKFKNGFEAKVYKDLEAAFGKGNITYEPYTFHYKVDETRKYTPDFYVKDRLLYVEGKGKWTGTDRKKMLMVIDQHPEIEFRMFFVSGNKRLSKVSKTTYGDWCDKNGIKWSDLQRGVPKEWINKTTKTLDMKSQPLKLKNFGSSRLAGTPGS